MLAGTKFLILAFQLLMTTNAQKIRKEFSLSGPYDENEVHQIWDFTGNAESQTSSIRLTSEVPGITGGIWSKNPSLSNNWEVQINFRIQGKTLHGGEGIAIWYTRDSKQPGAVFGSRDYFSGLGIFIDTVIDEDEKFGLPYIYGIVSNGSLRFLDNVRIGGCNAAIRNLIHWTKVAVSYSGDKLTVYVDNEGKNKWKLCFVSQGVHLPTAYKFGITASTDQFSDAHEIISLTTLDLDDPTKLWEDRSGIIPFAENVLMPIHPSKEDLTLDDAEEFESEDVEDVLEKVRREELEEMRKEEQRREDEERLQREEKEKQAKILRQKQQKEKREAEERRVKEEKEKNLKEEKERQHKQKKEKQQQEEKERRQQEEKERRQQEEKERRQQKEKERRQQEEKERRQQEEKERKHKEEVEWKEKEEKERQLKEEKEKRIKVQKEAKEKAEKLEKEKEEKPVEEESPPVPFIRKAIYILGTLLILVVIIKVYKKYSTQRREAQHKRLY